MKNKIDLSAIIGIILIIILSTVFAVVFISLNKTIHSKNEHIKDLNREISEYQAMESFWEDYIDLIGDIYEGKINEAVLEERVKWLENAKNENIPSNIYDVYVYQLLEDFNDAIEIIVYYYENTDQVVDLITYIATNYPALYARLLSYS